MKPEQQRIAIAEACGYSPGNYEESHGVWTSAEIACLPDYPHDLNAMHEAEQVLTDGQQYQYYMALLRLINEAGRGLKFFSGATPFSYIHATAAQRAEAFLKTKGLWK